jgi:hypothetical protein
MPICIAQFKVCFRNKVVSYTHITKRKKKDSCNNSSILIVSKHYRYRRTEDGKEKEKKEYVIIECVNLNTQHIHVHLGIFPLMLIFSVALT